MSKAIHVTSSLPGFDRSLSQRVVRLAPAVVLSLLLHGVALAVAGRVALMRHSFVTMLDPDAAMSDEEDLTQQEDQEEKPNDLTLMPGIDDGSQEARVTWIGYREYEEHLAELSEVDQAAFASSQAGGAADARDDGPAQNEEAADEGEVARLDDETVMPEEEKAEAESESAVQVPFPMPSPTLTMVQDMVTLAPMQNLESVFVSEEEGPEDVAVDDAPDVESPEVAKEGAAAEAASDRGEQAVAEATDEVVVDGETGGGAKQGDPTVDQDAEQSEKDTSATSVHEVPEAALMSGKPLAMEGLEIRPYSLYKHVLVDSNDRMLTLRWAGSIKQNAVVSLQFDSKGIARQVKVFRETGYESFDRLYLRSWLARWTAKGEDLKKLKPGEMCEPIVFTLRFIEEKK